MKRMAIAFMASLLTTMQLSAQTIPNSGFENWTSGGGPFPMATGWALTPVVVQSSVAHSGSFSLLCKNDTIYNPMASKLDTLPGHAYTGFQQMGPPPPPGSVFGGFPFSLRPDSIAGWTMFIQSGVDSGRITATLSKWNSATASRDVIGTAQVIISNSSTSYVRFAMPISYLNATVPDTALVDIATGGNGTPFAIGTKLWVDDLAFTYDLAGITSSDKKKIKLTNPFSNTFTISTAEKQALRIVGMDGKVYATGFSNEKISTCYLPSGVYMAQLIDLKTKEISNIKICKTTTSSE